MNISVALCTYNGDRFIKQQLDSILSQSLAVKEIVICDDCSTDGTAEILRHYEQNNSNIKLYFNTKSLGVIKNFEKAINLCTDGLVFLSDQDDIWLASKVEETVLFFKNNQDKKAVFHNLRLLNEGIEQNFSIWEYLAFEPDTLLNNKIDLLLYAFAVETFGTGAAFAFLKSKPVKFEVDIDFMLHDFQLLVQFANENLLGLNNKVLGLYRLHDQQQVGAELKVKESVLDRKEIFFGDNIFKRGDLMMRALNRNQKYNVNPELFKIGNKQLKEELNKIKKLILADKKFLRRKMTLFFWLKNRRYHTTIKELLTK